jgi:hypothetical protein
MNARADCLPLLIACLVALPVCGQEETPFTRLFDTGSSAAEPLADEAVAQRTGWRLVPEDTVDYRFSGDAVFLNDKLAVVLRKKGSGAEVYSKAANGLKRRAALGHGGTRSSLIEALDALKIIENTSGAVMVEAAFKADSGLAALRFRLTTGEALLEVRSAGRAGFVHVQSPTRYVVVPDYFGDDLVFGPEAFRGLALPAENFCLHLLDGGDAMLMSVWQSSEQDVWLAVASTRTERDLCSSQIRCLKGKSIWLAFLESPGLWHAGSVSAQDDWKPPFPAKWRCSLVRDNGVADSWDMDRGPQPDQTAGKHQGPLLVYPIDRSTATPLTASCPTDVMRNTLGVGPCQYILACEGLAAQGDPTPNSVMNWVEKQFEGKKEKKAANDIKERLEQMVKHVADARLRIGRYAEFAGQVRKLSAHKPGSGPCLSIVDDLDRFIVAGLTPAASPERAKKLATEVAALIGKENALAACQDLGEQLRSIGAVQDSTLAKCRMAVRRLRQQGRAIDASQSQDAGVAEEVWRLAEQMLLRK